MQMVMFFFFSAEKIIKFDKVDKEKQEINNTSRGFEARIVSLFWVRKSISKIGGK